MPEDNEFNVGFDLEEMIDNLPPGLDREVSRILDFHVGRENSISRDQFLYELRDHMGFRDTDEREFRISINQLRKAGLWICSTGGINGGYWLAKDHDELNDWINREPLARIKDLQDQVNRMRYAAEKQWGRYSPEKQISLF
jgi:hypothetical protein